MKHFPIARALRAGLKNYNADTFKSDLMAGLIVSLIALPLSMALSIAIGLPPKHGLYTAIIAGIVCALLGGSSTQVSGPTAAFVVILAPIVSDFGLHGIIWCEIMAGIMLVMLGTARLGKLITYVPYTVVVGFTSGISIVIGTIALNDFLGLDVAGLKGDYLAKVSTLVNHLPGMRPQEFAIGIVTFLFIMFFGKVTHKIPSPVVGITVGTLLALFFSRHGYAVDTLATRYSYMTAGGLQHGIEPYAPALSLPTSRPGELFSIPDITEFKKLFKPALVIAALAALESLLSATAADSIAKTKHDPNAELNGIGIANIACAFFGGIPATGAIARTATAIHAGAKTPVTSIVHALFILLYIMTLAPYISYMPMAALAALLFMTACRMSHFHQFIHLVRTASRSDIIVLFGCFIPTVLIDMVAGVTTGMVLAGVFLMRKARKGGFARAAHEEEESAEELTK